MTVIVYNAVGLWGDNFPHLERGAVVEKNRIVFALPECPDVFVEETGKTHVLTPFAYAERGTLEVGAILDRHLGEERPDVLLSALRTPNPPLIAVYRCLRLFAHLRKVTGSTLTNLLHTFAHNRLLPELRDVWQAMSVVLPPPENLLHAMRTLKAQNMALLATGDEVYAEIAAGRLTYREEFLEFGILKPEQLPILRERVTVLHQRLQGPLTRWLQEQKPAPRIDLMPWSVVCLTSLVAGCELLFHTQHLVHALGMALCLYRQYPDLLAGDALGQALMVSSPSLDRFGAIGEIMACDEAARAMLPEEAALAPPLIIALEMRRPT